MRPSPLFIFLVLLLVITPLAVPARAGGVTIDVVLSRSSGSFTCGDVAAGVVRVTNTLQVPIQVYPSSDSVAVFASVTSSQVWISDKEKIGNGVTLQPGETQSFAFVLRLSSDPIEYYGYTTTNYGTVVQASIEGDVYHSTTYDPNAPVGSIFSDYTRDSGSTSISVTCSQTSSSSTESSSSSTSSTTETSSSSTSSTETSSSTSSSSGGGGFCLIATATYGSEMSPEVQFLRSFRNNQIMRTFAGSNFMLIFNAWYYSFSPSVAQHIRGNDPLRAGTKVLLYPLMGILYLSSDVFSTLSFQPELAALMGGIVASSLIGLAYLAIPLSGLLYLFRRRINPTRTVILRLLLGTLVLLTSSFIISELFLLSAAMMIVTAGIVLSALTLPATLAARLIVGRIGRSEGRALSLAR